MTIHSLTIENLRGFAGKHEIVFEDKNVAAFIGVNGSGKSTVLEAIIVALHNLIRLSDKRKGVPILSFSPDDISIGSSSGVVSLKVETNLIRKSSFNIKIPIPDSPPIIQIAFNDLKGKNWLRNAIASGTSLPIISAYKTSLPLEKDEGFYGELQSRLGREQTYFQALQQSIHFATLVEWLEDLVNLQNSEALKKRDFDFTLPAVNTVRVGLAQFLGKLENDQNQAGRIELIIEAFDRSFAYVKGEKILKFDQLSSGEQLVIGLVLDLIYRCVTANGHLPDPLSSEGIVLIDEIELHLHPRWQANIIKALTTTFPNIQFIISTHAPLVINQLKDNQVFALRKDGIVPGTRMQETYGMDASAVITNIMGAPSRPPEVSERFDEVAKLLDDPTPKNLNRVHDKLNALRKIISPNDLELIQLSNILSIEESAVDL